MSTNTTTSDESTSSSPAKKEETEATVPTKKSKINQATSIFTRSKTFQNTVIKTFHDIDTDNSGTIDREELYTGLLLIHLKLATYVGPAATKILSRDQVYAIFDTLDTDSSGHLNEKEFIYVMTILCSQIATRIAITMTLTLFIIPYLTKFILLLVPTIFFYIQATMLRFDVLQADDHILNKFGNYIPASLKLSLGPTVARMGLTMTFIPVALAKLDVFFSCVAVSQSKKIN